MWFSFRGGCAFGQLVVESTGYMYMYEYIQYHTGTLRVIVGYTHRSTIISMRRVLIYAATSCTTWYYGILYCSTSMALGIREIRPRARVRNTILCIVVGHVSYLSLILSDLPVLGLLILPGSMVQRFTCLIREWGAVSSIISA